VRATSECSVVLEGSQVARNGIQDTLGFLYHASNAENSNLLRFNLPIQSSGHSAYVLYDCGASHKFVRCSFIEKLKQENNTLRTRQRGFMKITMANREEKIARYASWLTLD